MTPEERAGFATAITEAIARACDELRAEQGAQLAALRQEHEELARAQDLRADQAVARADRADTRAEQLQRDLDATRELAEQPAITEGLIDARGVLRMVMRGGSMVSVPVAELESIIAARLSDALAEAELRWVAQMNSQVARALQRLGHAPQWTRTAVYRTGAVVSCYQGRTYVVRDGVEASMAQEPGEHPDVWERIGSHGLRVMKAKPEHLEPGDMYTEGESRFYHDGVTTTLLVPRTLKQSDLDRRVRPLELETRALGEAHGETRRIAAAASEVADEALPLARSAQAWVAEEGEAVVIGVAQTVAWQEARTRLVDSAALQRLVDQDDQHQEAA